MEVIITLNFLHMSVIMSLYTVAFQHKGDAHWGCSLGEPVADWYEMREGNAHVSWIAHEQLPQSQRQFVLIPPSSRSFTEESRWGAWWPQPGYMSSGKEGSPSHLVFPSPIQGSTGSCHREENKVKFLFKTHLLVCYLSHSKGRATNWGQIQQIPGGSFGYCCCCRCPGRGLVPVAALSRSMEGIGERHEAVEESLLW